jgi:membrane protease YdiL (CAAX protease family)
MMTDRFARLRLGRLVWWPLASAAALGIVAIAFAPVDKETVITAGAYVLYLALMLAALRVCHDAGIAPAEIMGPVPRATQPWRSAMLLAPLLLIFSAMCAWLTVAVAARLAPGWAAQQLADVQGPSLLDGFGPIQKVLLGITIAFLAPFVEEFVFRGLLLRKWAGGRGVRFGVFASAALFAVLHPHMSIGAFAFGVVLAIIYLSTGSLLPAVLIHVVNNGIVTLVSLRGRSSSAETAATQSLAEVQSEWAIPAITMVLAGAAIVSLTRPMLRHAGLRTDSAAMQP